MKNYLLLVIIVILFFGCNPDIFNLRTKARFDYSPLIDLKTSDTIKFTNNSLNANYYYWDFGDRNYSYEKNPKHIYRIKNSHRVKLFVAKRSKNDTTNIQDSDTTSQVINVSIGVPKANFWHQNSAGSKVSFFNISDYGINYLWDFGDGTTSTDENPIHTYVYSGTYKVKLIISNEIVSDSISQSISVNDEIILNNAFIACLRQFSIDVDYDGINDFEFNTRCSFTNTTSEYYIAVRGISTYQIYTDSVTSFPWVKPFNGDTIFYSPKKKYIPKVYVLDNKIKNSNITSSESLYIAYRNFPHDIGMINSGIYINNWLGDDIKYLCFQKKDETKTIIGWIKLKVSNYSDATLISFKIPVVTESLLINK